MPELEKAKRYIKDFIESLVDTQVYVGTVNNYLYSFTLQPQNISISFNRGQLDDLESYLSLNNTNSNQFKGFWGHFKFIIYIILGEAALIPTNIILKELLNENRDWIDGNLNYQGESWLNAIFYKGLVQLKQFLDEIIRNNDSNSMVEFIEEANYIDELISFYNNYQGFMPPSVSTKPLSYFKAAAIVVILNIENEKKSIKAPRLIAIKDQEIYKIVRALREGFFPAIKLPPCIFDYTSHFQDQSSMEDAQEDKKDELTNLLSKGFIDKKLQSIIDDAVNKNLPISIIMCDVDYFKKVNDKYGHQTGDDVLKVISDKISKIIGEKGKVVRSGGEEICIILPNHNIEKSHVLAERIRKEIEAYTFKVKDIASKHAGESFNKTISLGIAASHQAINYKILNSQADQALLAAKEKGRNQINISENGPGH